MKKHKVVIGGFNSYEIRNAVKKVFNDYPSGTDESNDTYSFRNLTTAMEFYRLVEPLVKDRISLITK